MFDSTVAERALTEKQQAVFDVVREFSNRNGYPPTVREIAEVLGVASTSTIHAHLAKLEQAGVLERDPTKPRALRIAGGTHAPVDTAIASDGAAIDLPLVGNVAAGAPILAEQHVEDHVRVPSMLTRRGESFVLKVRGDSMMGAGILDGDYVVVRHQPVADTGQIVVAIVDGEATCKRFERRNGRVVLIPENPTMEPFMPDHCEIAGVVTGVLRAL